MEASTKPGFIRATFTGTGFQLFSIQLINVLLCIVTLGLYYPWAKARELSFYYQETTFMGEQFTFHGTGREMFIGFLKALAVVVVLAAMVALDQEVGTIVAYVCVLALTPIVVHGALSYRMSHTSWKGIYFGYRGEIGKMMGLYLKGLGLTMVTFGIYSAWFLMDWNRYIMGNLRVGSAKFGFDGKGMDYLRIGLGGYLLTLCTFGIYGFWWFKNLFNYMTDQTYIEVDGNKYYFQGDATAGKVFELGFVNALLILFTLGLGIPWAMVRTIRFNLQNTLLHSEFDPSGIEQTEPDFKDATGEMLLGL
jgi:uncharacterized membrane protein YjgN (DUF898 family)